MAPSAALGTPSVTASATNTRTAAESSNCIDNTSYQAPADDIDSCLDLPPPSKWRTQGAGKKLLPDHRIQFCHSKVAFGRESVDIMQRGDSVFFRGVHRCGSVWACPVCSAQISETRRKQLQAAINKAIGQGNGVCLATFTFSHGLHDALADLLPKFRDALRRLKSGRQWQRIQQQFGIFGTIKALEVTHGRNGWHPHEHQLFFTNEPVEKHQLRAMEKAIFPLWLAACKKAGLPLPNAEHGVQVQGASNAADYVGKFGFASELTRSASKRGWNGGRTQWDLLRDYTASDGADAQAGELYREYVAAFAGARQLVWSRIDTGERDDNGKKIFVGLNKYLEIGELFSDDQLADPDTTEAKLVVRLDLDTWALITRFDWHEDVVENAKLGRDKLLEFLNWVRCHCPLWDGRICGAKSHDEWHVDS